MMQETGGFAATRLVTDVLMRTAGQALLHEKYKILALWHWDRTRGKIFDLAALQALVYCAAVAGGHDRPAV